MGKKKATSRKPRPDTRSAKRTPLASRPPGKWAVSSAVRETLRERDSLARALLSPTVRREALAFVLGMKMLSVTAPALLHDLDRIREADDRDKAALVNQALQAPDLAQDTLDAFAVTVSSAEPTNTPNALGRAFALQLGHEVQSATPVTISPEQVQSILEAACAAPRPPEPLWARQEAEMLPTGFLLLPEDIYLTPRRDTPGLDIRALSWTPHRTPGGETGLNITIWSQSYGGATDPQWQAFLDSAEHAGVVVPRLTYTATAWAMERTPGGPLRAPAPGGGVFRDGPRLTAVDVDGTLPQQIVALIHQTLAAGALQATSVPAGKAPDAPTVTVLEPRA